MKSMFFLSILLMFMSCEKNKDLIAKDTSFSFILLTSDAKDLLDPSFLNSYEWDKIRLYLDIDNMDVPFYNSQLDNEYGYHIFKELDMEYYQISITEVSDNENRPFLLKLNDSVIDTIRCQVKRNGQHYVTDKIWYNEELVWHSNLQTPKVIRIIKN